ncbi:MAG TPA: hypothetical protein VJL59_22800 [Anaerolineales bacterium]|nr:hypothetical protein [Anaerolineales bacterium]
MTLHPPDIPFHTRVGSVLADAQLHVALDRATGRFTTLRADALASWPEAEAVRDRARQIRAHTLSKLDNYLTQFADAVEAAYRSGAGRLRWAMAAAQWAETAGLWPSAQGAESAERGAVLCWSPRPPTARDSRTRPASPPIREAVLVCGAPRCQHLRERRFEVFGLHRAKPLLNHVSVSIQQEKLRLNPEAESLFGVGVLGVVNVEVNEVNLPVALNSATSLACSSSEMTAPGVAAGASMGCAPHGVQSPPPRGPRRFRLGFFSPTAAS